MLTLALYNLPLLVLNLVNNLFRINYAFEVLLVISVRRVESFLWLRYDSWLRSIKTLSDLFPGFEQLENGECSCWDCVLSSKNYGKTLCHSSQTHQPEPTEACNCSCFPYVMQPFLSFCDLYVSQCFCICPGNANTYSPGRDLPFFLQRKCHSLGSRFDPH